MSDDIGIFIYGVVVTAFVATALGLIVWGIVVDHQSRNRGDRGG